MRHDETQRELRSLRASIEATVVPIIGPDEARATPGQLKKRKAAQLAASAKAPNRAFIPLHGSATDVGV